MLPPLCRGAHGGAAGARRCLFKEAVLVPPFRGLAPLIGGSSGRVEVGPLCALLSAMAAAAAPPGPGVAVDAGLGPILREAVAALGRAGVGLAAALGAVPAALAAAGGPAALGERERALFGAFLRSLAQAPGAARPEGVWQRCFLEGPPGLVLCVLLEALGSAGSVRLTGTGRRAGVPQGWSRRAAGCLSCAKVRRGTEMVSGQPLPRPECLQTPHDAVRPAESQSSFSRGC